MGNFFKSIWGRLTAYFLTGLFAILPIVITIAIVVWVVDMLGDFVGPDAGMGQFIKWIGGGDDLDPETRDWVAYGVGWFIVLGGLFLFGFLLVELGIRKFVGRLVDSIVSRIPLIGQVYGTSKQLVGMLDQGGDEKIKGMVPVFCYFGKERNAGVLALLVSPDRYTIKGREYQIVIIPTAPIPFGGGMLFMPVDLVEPAEMSVDGLMSVYVSMGVTAGQFLPTSESIAAANSDSTSDT